VVQSTIYKANTVRHPAINPRTTRASPGLPALRRPASPPSPLPPPFGVYRIGRSALIHRVSRTSEHVYTVLRTHSAENKLIVSPDNSWGMEFRRLPGTQRSIRARTNLPVPRLVLSADRFFLFFLSRIHFLIVGRGIARIVTLRGARAPKLLHRPQREARRGAYEFSGIEGSLSLSLSFSLSFCLLGFPRELIWRIQWHREHSSSFDFGLWRLASCRGTFERRVRGDAEFTSCGFVRVIPRLEKSCRNRTILGDR